MNKAFRGLGWRLCGESEGLARAAGAVWLRLQGPGVGPAASHCEQLQGCCMKLPRLRAAAAVPGQPLPLVGGWDGDEGAAGHAAGGGRLQALQRRRALLLQRQHRRNLLSGVGKTAHVRAVQCPMCQHSPLGGSRLCTLLQGADAMRAHKRTLQPLPTQCPTTAAVAATATAPTW